VALSADGNTVVIGGYADNSQVGAAWVYTRSGNVWTQQGGKLIGTGAVGPAYQGWSVALSGDGNTAIVGGIGDNSYSGAAWVFVQPTNPLQVTPTTNIVTAGNPGGPFTPSSFQYQLSATVGSIDYSISGYPNWLTPSSTSGTASTGTTVTFTVNATANSLAVSTYGPTTITFANSDTGQGTTTMMATLIVNAPSLLVTPTTSVTASGIHGGPFSPKSFQYKLSTTYGSVKYSIATPSWLTASSASGTLTTSAKTITFTISSSADKLSPTTYVNSISFNNTTNSQGNTTRVANAQCQPEGLQAYGEGVTRCRRHGQRRWRDRGRQFDHGDSDGQQWPQLCAVDREREGGQHVIELYFHNARQRCDVGS
jgi:Viral BACON domain